MFLMSEVPLYLISYERGTPLFNHRTPVTQTPAWRPKRVAESLSRYTLTQTADSVYPVLALLALHLRGSTVLSRPSSSTILV